MTVALGAVPLAAPGLAADAGTVQVAQADPAQSRIRFSVPAQPLANALILFGRQSGLQVSMQGDVPAGLQSQAVAGEFTPHEALARLLSGTGITYRFNDARTVTLIPAPQGSGATVLPTITVAGNQSPVPATATLHNLSEAYPGGQVARGGSLGLLGSRDVMDTPFSTVNYTSAAMEDQQARTAADTLINDPSVRLSTGSNGFDDTFMIRGFAVPAGDVGFNGLYGLVSSNRVPSQLVERIELLKGPGALINGIAPGGSIGGGINIVSKRAGDEPLTRLTTTFVSDANFATHADVARRAGPDNAWGIRFNGLLRDGEASIDGGDVEGSLGALALDYRGERLRWTVDLISQRDDTDNFRPQISLQSGLAAIPSAPDARSNWYPGTTLVQKDRTVASQVEYDITESLTAYAGLGYRHGENDQIFPVSTAAVTGTGSFSVRNSYYDSYSKTTSGNAGVRWSFDTAGIGHTLNVGFTGFLREEGNAYIQSAGTTTSNIYNPSPLPVITAARTDPTRSAETTLTSVAVADTLSFLEDRVLLTLGVRDQNVVVDSYSTTTGALTSTYDAGATTPLAGLVVKPWADVSLYANYAEGLSRGSIVGAGYANTGAVLAPYKSKQYETGVKVDWGSITTTAALFQISRPNLITTPANMRAYDGEQRNRGLELSAYGEFQPGLRGMAGATFLEPTITRTSTAAELGKDAAGVPDMMLSAGLDWDAPWIRGLAFNGRVIYTSGAYLNNTNTAQFDPWTRFDIGARYRTEIAGTPVVLRANVENLFDKTYWLTTGTYVTVGAPRTFVLSASVDF
jgi:iron complex outermembrane receptor protein